MKKIYFSLFLLISVSLFAQETIKVMQYNLTYYGETTSWCTTSNNNVSLKDGFLNTIIDEVQPDVFCVNELGTVYQGGDNIIADRLLNYVMNDDGDNYERADHTGTSNICNMIYFNKDKLAFYKQGYINKDLGDSDIIREIDFYTLYYKDATLATHNDTIFMTFAVAHLKAGNTDDYERGKAAEAAMDYIAKNDLGQNLLFMGDLNVYTDQEDAYQFLTNNSNSSINFYDPINQEGEWHNGNVDFGKYHTQSTRVSANSNDDCYSTGGMDDRFDFVLINKSIRDNLHGVVYKTNSYKALGNDGTITDTGSPMVVTGNTAVNETLAQALFDMSDHLPIVLELDINQGPLAINEDNFISNVELNNPVSDELKVRITSRKNLREVTLNVHDLTGKVLISNVLNVNNNRFYQSIVTQQLPQGIYVLNILDTETKASLVTEKIVKQ